MIMDTYMISRYAHLMPSSIAAAAEAVARFTEPHSPRAEPSGGPSDVGGPWG
jgi:hypothetical protein